MPNETKAENRINTPQPTSVVPSQSGRGKKRSRGWLYRWLDISWLVDDIRVMQQLPFLFYLTLLGLLYIFNAHQAEKNIRALNGAEKKAHELRWLYLSEKADLDNLRKQSEIARLVQPLGLEELRQPPWTMQRHAHRKK